MAIDIYKEITDKIIAALEQGGLPPWVKPWSVFEGESALPSNYSSGKPYRGANIISLWASQAVSGYESSQWVTYKQAAEKGLQVRKGQKGSHVIFWKFLKKMVDGEEQKIPMARAYTVFNLDQCDGYEHPDMPAIEWQADNDIDSRVSELQAEISHGGTSAYFSPKHDEIRMPDRARFKTKENYYATLLHELTHWTGHKSRLDRPFIGGFGSPDYAREELVAELGAAFLCAHYKLDGQLQHEQYIDNWLSVLRGDKKAIVRASSLAQQAADLVIGREPVDYLEE